MIGDVVAPLSAEGKIDASKSAIVDETTLLDVLEIVCLEDYPLLALFQESQKSC